MSPFLERSWGRIAFSAMASLFGVFGCDRRNTSTTPLPTSQPTTKKIQKSMSADDAKAALWKATPWTRVRPYSPESARLIDTLVEVCKLDTPALREVVSSFMQELKADNGDFSKVDEWSKVYVLNRIAFEAPLEFSIEIRGGVFFGGWGGVPIRNRMANLSWPVECDTSGILRISGEFGGFRGPPYYGVEEFDFFAERFPRRKPKGE